MSRFLALMALMAQHDVNMTFQPLISRSLTVCDTSCASRRSRGAAVGVGILERGGAQGGAHGHQTKKCHACSAEMNPSLRFPFARSPAMIPSVATFPRQENPAPRLMETAAASCGDLFACKEARKSRLGAVPVCTIRVPPVALQTTQEAPARRPCGSNVKRKANSGAHHKRISDGQCED